MAIIVLSLQHGFRVAGGCACGRTKGLSDRPLETFGSHLSLLSFIESFLVSVLFVPPCNMKNQVTSGGAGEAVQRATADFVCFHCPLVAPAGAKPLRQSKSSMKLPSTAQKRAGESPPPALFRLLNQLAELVNIPLDNLQTGAPEVGIPYINPHACGDVGNRA